MPITIQTGDAVALLRAMPADSVHCCVTSPPYWGLRDYGTPPQVWGGDPDCRHRWGAEGKSNQRLRNGSGSSGLTSAGRGKDFIDLHRSTGAFCARCGAWRGSLGLEPTYQLYIDHLLAVLREVRRVLRPDGTLWLVIGDCFATGGGKAKKAGGGAQGERWQGGAATQPNCMPQPGLKPKDLVGIPWRVAFALQDEGWWLRRDQIWAKPNPMPESVRDRCTSAHEYLFLLTKSARYYYDGEAIREPLGEWSLKALSSNWKRRTYSTPGGQATQSFSPDRKFDNGYGDKINPGGRNKRSVWTIATTPFPEAHFATFPPALVEPCILAGTSERGVCSHCGAPWRRLVRGKKYQPPSAQIGERNVDMSRGDKTRKLDGKSLQWREAAQSRETIGWRASCDCPGTDPVPALVLDPFLGSGTTALVADRLGRDCIGLELSPAYAAMARRRTGAAEPRLRRAA